MPRGVAINVGANTNEPGVRGPVFPDGSAEFVPIPETEPTTEPPPTYADLDLVTEVPQPDQPVHLDPSFAEYPYCERYTYGDPWGVKARPLLELGADDWVFFYATLTTYNDGHPEWITDSWGAYLIGAFCLDRAPIAGDTYHELTPEDQRRYAGNAHLRRDPFDAAVLLSGDPEHSELFDRVIPLSGDSGTEPNRIVTELSADSGAGPWWRRPLGFDRAATATLQELRDASVPIL